MFFGGCFRMYWGRRSEDGDAGTARKFCDPTLVYLSCSHLEEEISSYAVLTVCLDLRCLVMVTAGERVRWGRDGP